MHRCNTLRKKPCFKWTVAMAPTMIATTVRPQKARQEAETDTAQEFEHTDKVGYGEWHPHQIEEGSRAFEPVSPIPAQHLLCTVSKKDDAQTTGS
jgi:hypothetical protein